MSTVGAMSTPTILFVDDEQGVLSAMKRLFRKENVNVVTASSGDAGLAILAEYPVRVVVSDQRMPGMSGTEFLSRVRREHSRTVRCILSGYAEMHAVMSAINDGNVYRFIPKPWDDDELKATLIECLELANSIELEWQARQDLARQNAENAELIGLQEAVLRSSRDLLDSLPIAVLAIDSQGRLVYSNHRFADEYGHLPGAVLGAIVGEPWRSVAGKDDVDRPILVSLDDGPRLAHLARVDIGGHTHTLLAMPSA